MPRYNERDAIRAAHGIAETQNPQRPEAPGLGYATNILGPRVEEPRPTTITQIEFSNASTQPAS